MNARNKFLLTLIGILVFAVGISFKSDGADVRAPDAPCVSRVG